MCVDSETDSLLSFLQEFRKIALYVGFNARGQLDCAAAIKIYVTLMKVKACLSELHITAKSR